MQSQQLLKMSSSSPNAGTQASVPLVDGIVNYVLLHCSPAQTSTSRSLNSFTSFVFFLVDPILHHSPNLVSTGLRSGLFGGHISFEMNAGVSHCSSLSRVPCAPMHCLVRTQRSRQTPAIWQVTTVD